MHAQSVGWSAADAVTGEIEHIHGNPTLLKNLERALLPENAAFRRTIADLNRTFSDPVFEQARTLAQQFAKEAANALGSAALRPESLDSLARERQALAEQTKSIAEDVRRYQELMKPLEMPRIDYVALPRPATRADVHRLEAKLDAAEAENTELRRRIAQIDLRTERIAKHFDPPADLDQPGQAEDEAE